VLGAGLVLGAISLVVLVARLPLGYASVAGILVAVLLAGLGGALFVQHWRPFSPAYSFDATGLCAQGVLSRRVLSYDSIDSLAGGRRAGRLHLPRWHLPGYVVGEIRSSELGPIHAYCTRLEPDALVIVSAGGDHLAFSPAEPDRFRQALIARLEPGKEFNRFASAPRLVSALDPLLAALASSAIVLVLGNLAAAVDALITQRAAGSAAGTQLYSLIYLVVLQLAIVGLNGGLLAAPGRLEPTARHVLAAAALCVALIAFISTLRLVR
jgi:hypothetical protein